MVLYGHHYKYFQSELKNKNKNKQNKTKQNKTKQNKTNKKKTPTHTHTYTHPPTHTHHIFRWQEDIPKILHKFVNLLEKYVCLYGSQIWMQNLFVFFRWVPQNFCAVFKLISIN